MLHTMLHYKHYANDTTHRASSMPKTSFVYSFNTMLNTMLHTMLNYKHYANNTTHRASSMPKTSLCVFFQHYAKHNATHNATL